MNRFCNFWKVLTKKFLTRSESLITLWTILKNVTFNSKLLWLFFGNLRKKLDDFYSTWTQWPQPLLVGKKSDFITTTSVTRKKLPNVYKSCLKMILLEKWWILTPLQKMSKNVGYLGKLIVTKGFTKLPKVQ